MARYEGSTKAFETRKIIDASIPKNISKVELEKLEAVWKEKAAERAAMIERQYQIPKEATKIISLELREFKNKWQSYIKKDKKWVPLLADVSLASSAIDAAIDAVESEIFKR